MMHPDTTLKIVSPEIGVGVFATAPIPKGTITYAVDELELRISSQDPRLQDYRIRQHILKYSTIEPDGSYLLSWDLAKYVNHCCHYNTLSSGYGFEIAVRDIAAGEQITDDYGIFNLQEPMHLICLYADCRGFVRPDDYDRLCTQWDNDIRSTLPLQFNAPQPLLEYLDAATLDSVKEYLQGRGEYRSVSVLRYLSGVQ
jgi:hypothetical protein